jgi:hypothetical protein
LKRSDFFHLDPFLQQRPDCQKLSEADEAMQIRPGYAMLNDFTLRFGLDEHRNKILQSGKISR